MVKVRNYGLWTLIYSDDILLSEDMEDQNGDEGGTKWQQG
jgi:hypothetical protein